MTTGQGEMRARAVVIATGTTLKTLGIPGEERLRGKGVSHCASCDAPLLRGRIVGVVGGGDSALQEALTLAQHVSRVIILHRGSAFSAQEAYIERVRENPKIEVRFGTIVEEVVGNGGLTGVRTRTVSDGKAEDLELAGLFVYVGLAPATTWLEWRARARCFWADPGRWRDAQQPARSVRGRNGPVGVRRSGSGGGGRRGDGRAWPPTGM